MSNSTLIASGTRLSGEISGSGDVTVAGLVDGTIDLEDSLTVASDGLVQGEIRAGVVTVEGAVDGTIEGTERVVLTESARVLADIETPNLIIDTGAQLSGDIEVTEGDGESSSRRSRRSSRSGRRRSSTTRSSRSTSATTSSTSKSSRTESTSTPSSSTSPTSTTSGQDEPTATSDSETSQSEESTQSSDEEASEAEETQSEDSLADMEAAEIADAYTVRELRDELRKRDLTVRGKKSTLVQRLVDKAGLGNEDNGDDSSED
jgi:cytoskeletal protein CcmA (bactofilin family)